MLDSLFVRAALVLALAFAVSASASESTCFGTVSSGRLENGLQLPATGANFSAYSSAGVSLRRTYVHSRIAAVATTAYAALQSTAPSKVFVYGETGWAKGGQIRPHKTHRNRSSVDFFVPVLNGAGKSVPIPTHALNKFGDDIDFDAEGRFSEYSIDFEAIGEHLFKLYEAAIKLGNDIALVIFDPRYLPTLFETKHGSFLKEKLKFMKRDAWVRHDEHYHVDFAIGCKPTNAKQQEPDTVGVEIGRWANSIQLRLNLAKLKPLSNR